jgi:hypothetical protein
VPNPIPILNPNFNSFPISNPNPDSHSSPNRISINLDLNLPAMDSYGTQCALGLIRQHIDYGHWYDTDKLTLKTVDDCQYVAALNPTAGSFAG